MEEHRSFLGFLTFEFLLLSYMKKDGLRYYTYNFNIIILSKMLNSRLVKLRGIGKRLVKDGLP